MRTLPLLGFTLALPLLVTACGSMEMRDTNAVVDADPLCASQPDRPNEPTMTRCERKTEVKYERRNEPLDLKRESRDDLPR